MLVDRGLGRGSKLRGVFENVQQSQINYLHVFFPVATHGHCPSITKKGSSEINKNKIYVLYALHKVGVSMGYENSYRHLGSLHLRVPKSMRMTVTI